MNSKQQKFKTKIGSGPLIAVVVIAAVLLGTGCITSDFRILWILLLLIPFIIYVIFSIRYEILGDELIIKLAFYYTLKIPVSNIHKIEETWGILSSPAPSTDRLELKYNKFDSVMISPRDKTGFVNALKEINPEIAVQWKK